MAKKEEQRKCPYCHELLLHPYWAHVQKTHPEEYQAKQTWSTLWKDYRSMGMSEEISLMVISELFNATQEDVVAYLKQNNIL